jgi:hypothetical protein
MKTFTPLTLVVAGAVGCAVLAGAVPSAHSFGTINGFGQRAEHERITRAALTCATGQTSDNLCFEPRSLEQLAGARGSGGAIGAPDLGSEVLKEQAHCDNGDYLAGTYPQTRAAASDHLLGCVNHARGRMRAGLDEARRLLTGDGRVDPSQVSLSVSVIPPHPANCVFNQTRGRAKCDAIEQFGRALHAVQDFYSHSNWADVAAAVPVGPANPPGLARTEVSPLFALFTATAPRPADVPERLSTGCFDAQAAASGERLGCAAGTRVRHLALNKDKGLIDPATGATSDPRTDRGKVGDNFARAVTLAIKDTRRQWRGFVDGLERLHPGRGTRMACAITHDDPVRTCP